MGHISVNSHCAVSFLKSLTQLILPPQAWRFKHWTAGHFSTVTLKITDKGGKCQLDLHQEGVPESEAESTKVCKLQSNGGLSPWECVGYAHYHRWCTYPRREHARIRVLAHCRCFSEVSDRVILDRGVHSL